MITAHDFLVTLALVLGVAGVTTIIFNKLKQPVVLGYLVAGLLVGPNVSFFFSANTTLIQALSELGVILLMFALGLEFRLGSLMKVGPTALVTGLFQCSVMMWFGYITGRAFGWTQLESVFLGAIIAISSTTIIARAFEDLKVKEPVRGIVVGVLLVEDLVAVLLMTILTAVATGAGVSAGELALTLGRLGAFLVALLVGGLLVVPRLMKLVMKQERDEMVVVSAIALAFGFSLLAYAAGYSVALGAFIAGSLVAESGEGHTVEHAIRPVRDLFAAVFFVSVGMLLDPNALLEWWPQVLIVTAVVVVGKIFGVTLGVFFTGNGVKTSVQSGLSLAQIGEFSFIIATLGLSLKATRDFMYPVAVAVSAITTLITPWLIKASPRVAERVEGGLPARVSTWVSLYSSWFERLRAAKPTGERSQLARRVRLLLIDVGCIIATLVCLALLSPKTEGVTFFALMGFGLLVLITLGVGLARVLRALGDTLAERALPLAGRVDLARAPRSALSALFRVIAGVLVMAPALALLSPFLPPIWVAGTATLLLLVLLGTFARRAVDFEGHLRAGAQVVAEALSRGQAPLSSQTHEASKPQEDQLNLVRQQLPGLGEPVSCGVPANSPVLGKSLAEINLRGRTGATVLAIHRHEGDVVLPTANEKLSAGDIVALAGSTEAVAAARALLWGESQMEIVELPAT
ncbi:MAG: potassium transporter [Archangium gephyra]|uniref:Potassium transporter n=1 Tax=Archangium gephyra TaxID=48 RepID=A0A2W5THM5_9BACT|nr:MAG: potassium transporter [Archangium gephyra]